MESDDVCIYARVERTTDREGGWRKEVKGTDGTRKDGSKGVGQETRKADSA